MEVQNPPKDMRRCRGEEAEWVATHEVFWNPKLPYCNRNIAVPCYGNTFFLCLDQ